MKRIVFCFVILFVGCTSSSKGQSNRIIDEFFIQYEKNIEKAIDELFLTNPVISIESDAIVNLKKQLGETVSSLGNYNGSEFISSHTAGASESLVLYSYLVKYDNQPIRFQFTLYKPKDKWLIYNFQYDAKLNEELITSSQLFFLSKTFRNDNEE